MNDEQKRMVMYELRQQERDTEREREREREDVMKKRGQRAETDREKLRQASAGACFIFSVKHCVR
jgi:hypothetical protein